MGEVVVLLGPPGSGKSTVARALRDRLGWRWRDHEADLVARHGSRDAFIADKGAAVAQLHRTIVEDASRGGPPLVVESTGLTDAPLLDVLRADHAAFVVRLDVGREVARARIEARPGGEHLSDEIDASLRVLEAYEDRVLPSRRVDLVIDTGSTSVDDAVTLISPRRAPRG